MRAALSAYSLSEMKRATQGAGDLFSQVFVDCWAHGLIGISDAQAVFRARTESVAISASVKRGNAPVANLTANDFRLTDNGVAQSIEAVTIESVPLDVTLFMDTSGSTAGALDRMKRNVVVDRRHVAARRSIPPADDRPLGRNAGAVAASRQSRRARHEGRAWYFPRLRRAVRGADACAGDRTAAFDRRDDRWRGLRQPARWRARP